MINNEIANLHQKSPGFLSKADENLLIRWIDEIENPDNEVLTLSRLCERIGISKTQVYRKIKALTGMAPNEFIMDIRLRRAFKLLKRKELNISEIAATLGFLNPSYFSKCFNKRFGVLPSSLIR